MRGQRASVRLLPSACARPARATQPQVTATPASQLPCATIAPLETPKAKRRVHPSAGNSPRHFFSAEVAVRELSVFSRRGRRFRRCGALRQDVPEGLQPQAFLGKMMPERLALLTEAPLPRAVTRAVAPYSAPRMRRRADARRMRALPRHAPMATVPCWPSGRAKVLRLASLAQDDRGGERVPGQRGQARGRA